MSIYGDMESMAHFDKPKPMLSKIDPERLQQKLLRLIARIEKTGNIIAIEKYEIAKLQERVEGLIKWRDNYFKKGAK